MDRAADYQIVLYRTVGAPVGADGIWFVPAMFDFVRESEGAGECHLAINPEQLSLREVMGNDDLDEDLLATYWVRARIPAAFGFQPPRGWDVRRPELLSFLFLAVIPSAAESSPAVIPFVCAEDAAGPGLGFVATATDSALKQRIASAFWDVLFHDPKCLEPFEELLHDSEGGWVKVGYERGRLFVCEVDDIDDPSGRYDPHVASLTGELFRCPDCDGTGVEDLFPYTEDCATCGGTGSVTW